MFRLDEPSKETVVHRMKPDNSISFGVSVKLLEVDRYREAGLLGCVGICDQFLFGDYVEYDAAFDRQHIYG